MVKHFYHLGDLHAPMAEYLPMIDPEIKIRYPDGSGFDNLPGFEEFYANLIRQLFDEHHGIAGVTCRINGTQGEVDVHIDMTAKMWNPPAPKSVPVLCDAYFTWGVKRAPDGRPVITTYTLTDVQFRPGSAVYIPNRYPTSIMVPAADQGASA
jgi:hypothetical protein